MIRTLSSLRRAGLGLAAALLASSAQAGTGSVSFQDSFLDQATNWTHKLRPAEVRLVAGHPDRRHAELRRQLHRDVLGTNNDAQPQDINVTVGGTLTLLCPNGSGNCANNGTSNRLFQVMPSQTFPYPGVPVGGTISDTLTADPPAQTLTLPAAGNSLTLANFIGPGSLTFQGAATGGSVVIGPGNITSSISTRASVVLTVTYTFDTQEGPCLDNTPDTPGSLLLYPRFDSRSGKTTIITVTNTNCSFLPLPGSQNLYQGTVDVEFVYVGRYGRTARTCPAWRATSRCGSRPATRSPRWRGSTTPASSAASCTCSPRAR